MTSLSFLKKTFFELWHKMSYFIYSVFQVIFLAVLNLLPLATRKYQWLIQLQNELTWLTHRRDGAIQSDWAIAKTFLHKTDSTVDICSLALVVCEYNAAWLIIQFCLDERMLSDSDKRAGSPHMILWLVRIEMAGLFMWMESSLEFFPDAALSGSKSSAYAKLLLFPLQHVEGDG